MVTVAVIDVGTVTARLAISVVEDGRVADMQRRSTIVNLGQDVDKTGALREDACKRLLDTIDDYLAQISLAHVDAVSCTLTSAARDAKNSGGLTQELERRGLISQVIPGQVEGSLTFLGVAQDYPDTPLIVADNGGGSTEFALGLLESDKGLSLDIVRSIDVGCRRITEKFLSRVDPPTKADIDAAHEFAREKFSYVREWRDTMPHVPERLVVTGGTSTTLVALEKELVPYDSAQVHLASLGIDAIERQERRLAAITAEERAHLKGIQVKRAPVILGGVIAVSEVMRAAGFEELTVSESDLLVGLSLTLAAAATGDVSMVGWKPELR